MAGACASGPARALARAYEGKAALLKRMEQIESQMFQAKAAQRVAQRKLQGHKSELAEANTIQEASRAQLGSLASLVKKAQGEKTEVVRSLAQVAHENDSLREQFQASVAQLDEAKAEASRLHQRCELLEQRLVVASQGAHRTRSPGRKSSASRSRPGSVATPVSQTPSVNPKTRNIYGNPRVGPPKKKDTTGETRPLTAKSAQSEAIYARGGAQRKAGGVSRGDRVLTAQGRPRPLTAR